MTKFVRILLAASVFLCAGAVTAQADPTPEPGVNDAVPPIRIFDRELNTLLLPQFREPDPYSPSRRAPKLTTLLQIDAEVGERSDLMFRVQAKQKQFLYLEFRF